MTSAPTSPMPPKAAKIIVRVTSSLALVAIAVWLGGLLALGALVAPVIFSMVPLPASADAMVVVFQRFDTVAMTCAAIVLCAEAARPMGRLRLPWTDVARASLSVAAAAAAVFQGVRISPRIAELHGSGALRGVGDAGMELARIHDVAEACGKAQALFLVVVVVLHVVSLTTESAKASAAHSHRHGYEPEGASPR